MNVTSLIMMGCQDSPSYPIVRSHDGLASYIEYPGAQAVRKEEDIWRILAGERVVL